VNANTEVRNDGFLTIWRDLTTEPVWKYEELPPFLLPQLTKCDLFEAGDSELSRAIWFWFRRPKPMFSDSAALIVVALCVAISLVIAWVNWPVTSAHRRVTELVILLSEVAVGIYLIIGRLRFFRWRRDYERSIDRIIRTTQPGV
jgi:hypothetical protein